MDNNNQKVKGIFVFLSLVVGIICPLIFAIIEVLASMLPILNRAVDESWYVTVVFYILPFYLTYIIIKKLICKNSEPSLLISMFVLGIIYLCFAFIYIISSVSLWISGNASQYTPNIISTSIVVIIAGIVFLMHGIDAVKK